METKPINKRGKGDYQTSSNFLSLQGRARESRLTLETLVLLLLAAARNWKWGKKAQSALSTVLQNLRGHPVWVQVQKPAQAAERPWLSLEMFVHLPK